MRVPEDFELTRSDARKSRPSRSRSYHQISFALDFGGALLVLATLGWLILIADVTGGQAVTTCGVIGLAAAAYAVARLIGHRHDWIVPALIVVAAGAYAYLRRDILLGGPHNAPLGYSNAAGSLFMLSSAAALLVFARVQHPLIKAASVAAAIACASVPWLNQTRTASALLLFFPLALLAGTAGAVRKAVLLGAAAAASVFGAVLVLAYTYSPARVPDWVHGTISERRLMLWRDALKLMADHPVTGVGPNLFPRRSPTAIRYPDTIWPHNEFLHLGAEAGVVGLILIVGLFAIAYLRLWWGAADAGAALAAAALTAVAIHANLDYVLHYPAIGMVAAALVGTGASSLTTRHSEARRRRRSPDTGRSVRA